MFAGTLSRGAYARAAAIRIAAFIAMTAAFPFLLMAILKVSGCAGIGGACGALGLVVAIYFKPVIYLAFVVSFVGITVRRVRDLSLPVALAAILPILMLGDAMFGVAMGAPWSVGFALGASGQWPRFLFASLLCIAFLCLLPATDKPGSENRWGVSGAVALGLLIAACIGAVIRLFQDFGPLFLSDTSFTTVIRIYALYGTSAILVLLLTFVVWRHRNPV
jgi:uncharacterized membrane protein YhaH (DUF805 family)